MNDKPQDINSSRSHKHSFEKTSFDKILRNLDALPTGYVQVIKGEYIGRIVVLNRSMTRLGLSGHACAVIANRGDEGYFLTPLDCKAYPLVDGKPTGDTTIPLSEGSIIEIDGIVMKFHQGNYSAADTTLNKP
jgi:hypothetical protein